MGTQLESVVKPWLLDSDLVCDIPLCGLEAGLVLDWGPGYGGKDILRLRAAKRKIAEMTERSPGALGSRSLLGT